MFVRDTATPLSSRRTPEGFLQLTARIGRAGLQDYRAGEIGGPPGASPDSVVRVYRPPDEVFAPESLASFAGKPITLDHPPGMIDSRNWKSFAVGHAGDAVTRDDDHVAADLVLADAAAVAKAEAGAELSNGYWADFYFTPGVTPDGQPYDAVQRNVRGNHIALVDVGRCGPSCTIGGAPADGGPVAADAEVQDCGCGPKRRLTLDGQELELDDAVALAIERLNATQARALSVRDAEIAALKAAVPDAARIDGLVRERAQAIDAARRLIGDGFDGAGLRTVDIRRAAVAHLIGAERVRDRDDAYVAAVFDALLHAPPGNPLAAHFAAGLRDDAAIRGAALASRNRYLTHAWKGDLNGDS